ncbi:class I SAM-dependent methyltransferase [Mariprofundus ferrinatatus]|nr:methyltransferase [Mariprofundus ferrinatatus]
MPATELLYKTALEQPAGRTLVINAHADALLTALHEQSSKLDLWQHFKPENNAIRQMGLNATETLQSNNGNYQLILLLPSKNRQQTHYWIAMAMQMLGDGGKLMVACANNHGAKSYEIALKKLAGNIVSSSKSKCRIFSARKTASLDREAADSWLNAGESQHVATHGLISRPGLFSWDRPDRGSELLLKQLPLLSGTGMDLCCGYGLLSNYLLRTNENIEKIHLVEADRLALDCSEQNCIVWREKYESHWLDAASEVLPGNMEWIVCNPPFHTGQTRDVELGQRIIENGCRSLKQGGLIYLVANRKLPYEQVLKSALKSCQTLIETEGFKVIRGVR